MGFSAVTGDGSRESHHHPALDLFLLHEEVKPGESRCYQMDLNCCHNFFACSLGAAAHQNHLLTVPTEANKENTKASRKSIYQ